MNFCTLLRMAATSLSMFALAKPPNETVAARTRFFLESLHSSNLTAAASVLDTHEVNWFGKVWMETATSKEVLTNCLGRSISRFDRIDTYTFEECISNRRARSFVLPAHRVFDDQSIVSISYFHQWSDSTKSDSAVCLVFKQRDLDWKIVSIVSVPWFKLRSKDNDSSILASFPEYRLLNGHLSISIPPMFKMLASDSGQVDFTYIENSVRSGVYSLDLHNPDFSSAPKDLPDPLFTYADRFFENLVAPQGTVSDHLVKFFPNGYWIEASVKPQDDEASKSITIIVRVPGTDLIVWIQFFGYKDVYEKIWREVDLSLRSIQLYR
jgi:hypothetical protein